MATVDELITEIRRFEGFIAVITDSQGADLDTECPDDLFEDYGTHYVQPAMDKMTVGKWINHRFRRNYPGYSARVLNHDLQEQARNTMLGTVRRTYPQGFTEGHATLIGTAVGVVCGLFKAFTGRR